MPHLTPEEKFRARVALHGDPALADEEVEQELLEEREAALSYSDYDAFVAACSARNLLTKTVYDGTQAPEVRDAAFVAAHTLDRFIEEADRAAAQGTSFRETFPNGRLVYYEGDDFDGFVADVQREFNFTPDRGEGAEGGFHCPSEFLDAIYGSDRWLTGS